MRPNKLRIHAKADSGLRRAVKKSAPKARALKDDIPATGEDRLRRVRRLCAALPGTTEKLSHGEPTFFVAKKVYAMFANNHHNDGHVAIWIPAPPGLQATLIKTEPKKFFRPPYVGVSGWVGIELEEVGDEELAFHICEAWRLIAPQKLQTS
jgi:hypothetical protein